jgi:hypothetical protein
MKTQRVLYCDSCGKKLEICPGGQCSEEEREWLTLSFWKGMGATAHYSFCSMDCVRRWQDKHNPKVPEVFLKSFNDESI